MNAIKLPVTAHPTAVGPHPNEWEVQASDGIRVATKLTREEAQQIFIALNSHDALVDALKFYARKPEECMNRTNHDLPKDLPGNMNDWLADIGQDAGDIARAALAKVEEFRKHAMPIPYNDSTVDEDGDYDHGEEDLRKKV